MTQEYYELLVLAARYAFTLLGVIVVWRSMRWLRQDSRQRKKTMTALPDAGYVGTLYVMEGQSKGMEPGDGLQLPVEGVLGSGPGCDVRVPHHTVGGRHALFFFQSDGLHLRPYRDERLQVDGQPLPEGCEAILQHGAVLTLGGVMLQLRLFAGVQVPPFVQAEDEGAQGGRRNRGRARPDEDAEDGGFDPQDLWLPSPLTSGPAGSDPYGSYDSHDPYDSRDPHDLYEGGPAARGKRRRGDEAGPANGRRR